MGEPRRADSAEPPCALTSFAGTEAEPGMSVVGIIPRPHTASSVTANAVPMYPHAYTAYGYPYWAGAEVVPVPVSLPRPTKTWASASLSPDESHDEDGGDLGSFPHLCGEWCAPLANAGEAKAAAAAAAAGSSPSFGQDHWAAASLQSHDVGLEMDMDTGIDIDVDEGGSSGAGRGDEQAAWPAWLDQFWGNGVQRLEMEPGRDTMTVDRARPGVFSSCARDSRPSPSPSPISISSGYTMDEYLNIPLSATSSFSVQSAQSSRTCSLGQPAEPTLTHPSVSGQGAETGRMEEDGPAMTAGLVGVAERHVEQEATTSAGLPVANPDQPPLIAEALRRDILVLASEFFQNLAARLDKYPAEAVWEIFNGPNSAAPLIHQIKRMTETLVDDADCRFPSCKPAPVSTNTAMIAAYTGPDAFRADSPASSFACVTTGVSTARSSLVPHRMCQHSSPSLSPCSSSSASLSSSPMDLFVSSTKFEDTSPSASTWSSCASSSASSLSPSSHPDMPYPYSGPWTSSEISRLRDLISSSLSTASQAKSETRSPSSPPQVDWDAVCRKLGGRRNKRQVLLKATQLGLKHSSTRPSRKKLQKSFLNQILRDLNQDLDE